MTNRLPDPLHPTHAWLEQDVLREAEMYGNQVLVAHESDDFQVVERWEPVTEVDVQTPLDVYQELAGEPAGPAIPGSGLDCSAGQAWGEGKVHERAGPHGLAGEPAEPAHVQVSGLNAAGQARGEGEMRGRAGGWLGLAQVWTGLDWAGPIAWAARCWVLGSPPRLLTEQGVPPHAGAAFLACRISWARGARAASAQAAACDAPARRHGHQAAVLAEHHP